MSSQDPGAAVRITPGQVTRALYTERQYRLWAAVPWVFLIVGLVTIASSHRALSTLALVVGVVLNAVSRRRVWSDLKQRSTAPD